MLFYALNHLPRAFGILMQACPEVPWVLRVGQRATMAGRGCCTLVRGHAKTCLPAVPLIGGQEWLSYFPEAWQGFARFSFHFVLPGLQSGS